MEIITHKKAIALGLKKYFTGKPCKRGHISERHSYNGECIACRDAYDKKIGIPARQKRQQKNPLNYYLSNAKTRAKRLNIEFSLTLDNMPKIPTHCPILGIPLFRGAGLKKGRGDNTLSLDRVDNSKGYTPDNVQWISYRGNQIKSNGTIEEHVAVIKYMYKHFNIKDKV